MAKIIASLPNTEEVNSMDLERLTAEILDLCSHDTQIQGNAAMEVNRFLSDAALRYAREHHRTKFIRMV